MAIIGHLYLGKTDDLEGECIKTAFLIIGLPLVPLGSYYCTWAQGFRMQGFRIKWQWKSLLFAYLRWWTSLVPLFAVFAILSGTADESTTLAEHILLHWAIPIILIVAWTWCCFWLTRPNAREKKQRSVLALATGNRAWPEILREEMLRQSAEALDAEWRKRSLPDWRRITDREISGDDLTLFYALLRHAKVLEPNMAWADRCDEVWRRIDTDWDTIAPLVASLPKAQMR